MSGQARKIPLHNTEKSSGDRNNTGITTEKNERDYPQGADLVYIHLTLRPSTHPSPVEFPSWHGPRCPLDAAAARGDALPVPHQACVFLGHRFWGQRYGGSLRG